MSDAISSQSPIDPDGPWITEEQDWGSRQNELARHLPESQRASRRSCTFTRAWTMPVLCRNSRLARLWPGISLPGAAGMDTSGLSAFHGYLIAVDRRSILDPVIRDSFERASEPCRKVLIVGDHRPGSVGARIVGLYGQDVSGKAASIRTCMKRAEYLKTQRPGAKRGFWKSGASAG